MNINVYKVTEHGALQHVAFYQDATDDLVQLLLSVMASCSTRYLFSVQERTGNPEPTQPNALAA